MILEPLMKPAEAAPLLGYSARHVRLLCQVGKLRHEVDKSPGGRRHYFIPESAIAEYRSQRERDAA